MILKLFLLIGILCNSRMSYAEQKWKEHSYKSYKGTISFQTPADYKVLGDDDADPQFLNSASGLKIVKGDCSKKCLKINLGSIELWRYQKSLKDELEQFSIKRDSFFERTLVTPYKESKLSNKTLGKLSIQYGKFMNKAWYPAVNQLFTYSILLNKDKNSFIKLSWSEVPSDEKYMKIKLADYKKEVEKFVASIEFHPSMEYLENYSKIKVGNENWQLFKNKNRKSEVEVSLPTDYIFTGEVYSEKMPEFTTLFTANDSSKKRIDFQFAFRKKKKGAFNLRKEMDWHVRLSKDEKVKTEKWTTNQGYEVHLFGGNKGDGMFYLCQFFVPNDPDYKFNITFTIPAEKNAEASIQFAKKVINLIKFNIKK